MTAVCRAQPRRPPFFTACEHCSEQCQRNHSPLLQRLPSFLVVLENAYIPLRVPSSFLANPSFWFDLSKPLRLDGQLEGPSGHVWSVVFEGRGSNDLFITEGWKDFAHDHCLSEGDFLTFKLVSTGFFSVSVYGLDGSEKADAFRARVRCGVVNAQCSSKRKLDVERSTVHKNNVSKTETDRAPKRVVIDLDNDDDECNSVGDKNKTIKHGTVEQTSNTIKIRRDNHNDVNHVPVLEPAVTLDFAPERLINVFVKEEPVCISGCRSPQLHAVKEELLSTDSPQTHAELSNGKEHIQIISGLSMSNGTERLQIVPVTVKEEAVLIGPESADTLIKLREESVIFLYNRTEIGMHVKKESEDLEPTADGNVRLFSKPDSKVKEENMEVGLESNNRQVQVESPLLTTEQVFVETTELTPDECSSPETSQNTLSLTFNSSSSDSSNKEDNYLQSRSEGRVKEFIECTPILTPKKVNSTQQCSVSFAKDYITEVYISTRRQVSESERANTIAAAKKFKSSRPFTIKVLKESHVYRGFWLQFPVSFSSQHLPNETIDGTLVDTSGGKWHARWIGERGGLSGGWRKFSLDHGLEEGDVCIFELIDVENLLIKVNIFRVVEIENALPGKDHYIRKPAQRSSPSPVSGRSPSISRVSTDCESPTISSYYSSQKMMRGEFKKQSKAKVPRSQAAFDWKLVNSNTDEELVNKNNNDGDNLTSLNTPSKTNKPKQTKKQSPYYLVNRLISRRKGATEDEFLVELNLEREIVCPSNRVTNEGSAWWVPLSYFTDDKMSCRL